MALPVVTALVSAGSILLLQGCEAGGDDNTSNSTSTSSGHTTTTTTTTTTAYFCPGDSEEDLAKPGSPFEHNGHSWRSMCANKTEAHFFGIGDWGGMEVGKPWDNTHGRQKNEPADDWGGQYVARQMNWRAGEVHPDFVLNAGDNFYPGGIDHHCASSDTPFAADPSSQFLHMRDEPFGGEDLKGKPWLSVLGNHDYGGIGHVQGWDLQIFHTWNGIDWRMPGQYWHQHVKYYGFAVDFFMLDSNYMDAHAVGTDSGHNICEQGGPPPYDCYGITPDTCSGHFNQLWHESLTWLEQKMANSTAEWKIIVTHFPGQAIAEQPEIKALHEKYGIDLLFTGHTHKQEIGWRNGIPFIISGGGGGITSEDTPSSTGRDHTYGFTDFTVNSTHLKADFFSWGGPDGSMKDIIDTITLVQGNHSKVSSELTV